MGVTIKSPAIVLPEMTSVTSANGIYRFPSLPPGLYEITFVLEGMNTLVRRDIRVRVNQVTTINVTMELKALEESVVVVGETPMIDVKSSQKSYNLDQEFIANIPSPRNIDAYFNMTPGIVAEPQEWGLQSSSHGSSVRDNAFNMDGVNVNNPAVGSMMIDVGMDVMDELSVQTGGLPAEFGDAMGSIVNIVTRSGGNTLSGAAYIFYSHESLQSTNTMGTPLEGEESGFRYAVEPGLTLGGPLAKDKLWFFTNLSFNKSERNVPGYPYDQEEAVPTDQFKPYPYIKLTYQPNQQNKFSLAYQYSDFRQDHQFTSQFDTVDTSRLWRQPTHFITAQWTRFFSNSFFMNFKVGYWQVKIDQLSKKEEPGFRDLATGLNSGAAGLSSNFYDYRIVANTDATYFVDDWGGSHEFKVGAEYQYVRDGWQMTPHVDPKNDMSTINTYFGFPVFGVHIGTLDNKQDIHTVNVFAQDSWRVGTRLTLNLGLRFSHQRGVIPPQNQDEGPQDFLGIPFNRSVTESFTPIKLNSLAPRLGLVFDITGDGKTLLKASYSRYVQPLRVEYFQRSNPNNFFVYGQALFPDATPIPGAYLFADIPSAAAVGYSDHNLTYPRTDEIVVGIERELFTDWSLGARYIRKRDRKLMEDVNANQLDVDKLMDQGELVWTNWVQVPFTDPHDNQQKYFWSQKGIVPNDFYILNPPGADRDYDGFEVFLNKRFSKNWSLMASYVWQHSRGLLGTDWGGSYSYSPLYNDPNSHINAVGRFPLERRNQVKFQGMWRGPWGINISGFFRWFTGSTYTRDVSSADLGVPLSQGNTIIFAEGRGSRNLPALVILDFRLEKMFQFSKYSIGIFADAFNLFNANSATDVITTSSSPVLTFEEMIQIQDPRTIRLGFRFQF